MENCNVVVIGVPMDLGASRRGTDMGPSAIRYAGISDAVAGLDLSVRDAGNIEVPAPETRDPGDSHVRYLREIASTWDRLSEQVREVDSQGGFPLVLGGDHSVAVGTVHGVQRNGRDAGMIWVDAHGDFNDTETTLSGNVHGMPLSSIVGVGTEDLLEPWGDVPHIDPARTVLVGVRDLDPDEREKLRRSEVQVYSMRDIDEQGMAVVMEQAIRRATQDGDGETLHVSLDMDALDPSVAMGVGTPVRGGLTYREAHLAMEMLADTGAVGSAEVVEVNPILDRTNQTANLAVELVTSLLGKTIL